MTLDNTVPNKIQCFLEKQHLLSLATCSNNQPYCCSVFYVYNSKENCFIFASSDNTQHVENIAINNNVAGTIDLNTDVVATIQGIQFKGKVEPYNGDKTFYFVRFPLSVVLKPKLWKIEVKWLKMTDNTLGFGKKIIWQKF